MSALEDGGGRGNVVAAGELNADGDTGGGIWEAVTARGARRCGVAACPGGVWPVAMAGAAGGQAGAVLGAEGCIAGGARGRGAGADRAERRGEDHAAEDIVAHHAADGGLGGDSRTGAQPVGGGNGVPSGADGAGEYVSERVDFGDEQAGDRPGNRRDRGPRGDRKIHRDAGKALFERDVRAAGVFGGGAP